MKKLFACAITALLLLAFTAPVRANPGACFDWICYTDNGECHFDAGCSASPGDTPLNYRWIWGDGSPLESIWSDPLASHTYAYPIASSYVTLSVGYLLIGYYDVTCRMSIRNVISPASPSFSGTCS